MQIRTIGYGDTVVRLAAETGFAPDTIWNDEGNAELKSQRDHMDVLAVGDQLVIPDLVPKSLAANTGHRYRYRRHGVPMKFCLQVLDAMGVARADRPYRLLVNGVERSGTTDGAGVLEVYLPNASSSGELLMDELKLELQFGVLEPKAKVQGVQQRLTNLGSRCEDSGGRMDEVTALALGRFQRLMGLPMTGEIDEKTEAALQEEHEQIGSLAARLKEAQGGS